MVHKNQKKKMNNGKTDKLTKKSTVLIYVELLEKENLLLVNTSA